MISNPHSAQEQASSPRIYVASLSDYNAGRLHGVWLDANQDPDDLLLEVQDMLSRSSEPYAEEFAIHDDEGFFGLLSEFTSLHRVSEIAQALDEYGEPFALYAQYVGTDYALRFFEEAYCGTCHSIEDWAFDLIIDLYDVPIPVHPYLDAKAFARDLQLNGDYHFASLQSSPECAIFAGHV